MPQDITDSDRSNGPDNHNHDIHPDHMFNLNP